MLYILLRPLHYTPILPCGIAKCYNKYCWGLYITHPYWHVALQSAITNTVKAFDCIEWYIATCILHCQVLRYILLRPLHYTHILPCGISKCYDTRCLGLYITHPYCHVALLSVMTYIVKGFALHIYCYMYMTLLSVMIYTVKAFELHTHIAMWHY